MDPAGIIANRVYPTNTHTRKLWIYVQLRTCGDLGFVHSEVGLNRACLEEIRWNKILNCSVLLHMITKQNSFSLISSKTCCKFIVENWETQMSTPIDGELHETNLGGISSGDIYWITWWSIPFLSELSSCRTDQSYRAWCNLPGQSSHITTYNSG
jgi:hypothetical protein